VRVISTTPDTPALERARAAGVDTLLVDPSSGGIQHGDTETRRGDSEGSNSDILAGQPTSRISLKISSPSASVSPCLRGDSPPESLDARLIAAFQDVGADTIALTGFMRKLGPSFLRAFPQRVLNIHAALLPCFGGQGFYGRRVHEAVIESGARFSGATVHFVDDQYDHGPIILQAVVPVENDDTAETLAARVLEQEHRLYPEALRLLAEGRLTIEGRRVRVRK
jgi:formyltetrahydrofolate-dependent phosphoribosylglycinamide formyltransferase